MTNWQWTQARPPFAPSSQTKVAWSLTTALWSVVAFVLPINRALPFAPRAVWFACILLLLAMPMFFLRVARPLYPAVWAFSGLASLVALLTATKAASVSDNIFVGLQLIALLGLGAFTMTANIRFDSKFVQRVSIAFLAGQSLSAFAAVSQVLGQSVLGPAAVQGRALGLAGHPNTLGLMSCVAILISLQILVVNRRFRFFVLAALATNLLALFASGSLTSLMAVSIGFAVWILCNRDRLGKLALSGVAFIAALWLLGSFTGVAEYFPSLAERYRQVTGQTAATSSWEFRTRTYEFAWGRILEEPIYGNGLGAGSSGTFNGVTVTHNLFLRGWYQGGILLAIGFALILAGVLLLAVQAVIRKEKSGEASILIAIAAFALTSAFFEQRDYWLPILVAWGAISASRLSREPTDGFSAQSRRDAATTRTDRRHHIVT